MTHHTHVWIKSVTYVVDIIKSTSIVEKMRSQKQSQCPLSSSNF
ncbi:hypothetical protein COO91_09387 (plasmid) [Nostoc flagelliforme CCNUN1]|uniref:Uncharacterized protein n=1 Tax=Nostoc flagelliforme CCNUN1 TaxID=2038116 RepID=A0A2K8T691_9NOSO|nr:hypothetical protein COO91_09387 [Nostoc flagelliforme CCNUN1]